MTCLSRSKWIFFFLLGVKGKRLGMVFLNLQVMHNMMTLLMDLEDCKGKSLYWEVIVVRKRFVFHCSKQKEEKEHIDYVTRLVSIR